MVSGTRGTGGITELTLPGGVFQSLLCRKHRLNNFPNRVTDGFDGSDGIHNLYPLRFGGRNCVITLSDTAKETAVGFFKAIALDRLLGLTGLLAFLANVWRNMQQQRKLGASIADGNIDD